MSLITKGDLSISGLMASTEGFNNSLMAESEAAAKKAMADAKKGATDAEALAKQDEVTTEDARKAIEGANSAMDVVAEAIKTSLSSRFGLDKLFSGSDVTQSRPINILK